MYVLSVMIVECSIIARSLRCQVQQYPSNETLLSQLRTRDQWIAYKRTVVGQVRRQSRLRHLTLRHST